MRLISEVIRNIQETEFGPTRQVRELQLVELGFALAEREAASVPVRTSQERKNELDKQIAALRSVLAC